MTVRSSSILPGEMKGTERALHDSLGLCGKRLKLKYRVGRKPRKNAKQTLEHPTPTMWKPAGDRDGDVEGLS